MSGRRVKPKSRTARPSRIDPKLWRSINHKQRVELIVKHHEELEYVAAKEEAQEPSPGFGGAEAQPAALARNYQEWHTVSAISIVEQDLSKSMLRRVQLQDQLYSGGVNNVAIEAIQSPLLEDHIQRNTSDTTPHV